MTKIVTWLKENKLTAILIFALAYVLLSGSDTPLAYNALNTTKNRALVGISEQSMDLSYAPAPVAGGGAPRLDISDRKVVTNSTLSLVVSDVRKSIKQVTGYAKENGGYMVTASQTAPEGLANGTISIRVPSDALEDTLEYLRSSSIKVVSESLVGRDITDQFMDVEARLSTLENTKARYESILDKAVDVDEILRVTQQILYIQDQIDNLKGQLTYMDATAKSSLITIYLSTDEFELPYSPDQPWRPNVVFKYAVRSLVQNLREISNFVVWGLVYSVIWLPALLIFKYIRKKKTNLPQ